MTEPRSSRKLPSEHEQAVKLLTRARDILAQRLTERVLELGIDLLDDARGESYTGEIDSLYDQIGTRLNQINTMLASLPATSDGRTTESFSTEIPDLEDTPHFVVQTTGPLGDSSSGELLISENLTVTQETTIATETGSSYPLFVQDIIRRDTVAAGRRLAYALGIGADRAEHCASRFREQLDRDPAFLSKVQALRKSLQSGASNEALLLLWDCFGLQGNESIAAMQAMRGWL